MKHFRMIIILAAFFGTNLAYATLDSDALNQTNSYKVKHEIEALEIVKPTVVQAKIPDSGDYNIAILENETQLFQPYLRVGVVEKLIYSVSKNSPIIGNSAQIFDGNYDTSAEFDLDNDAGRASIEFTVSEAVEADGLKITLGNNVALPYKIEISAWMDGAWKKVLAETKMSSSRVDFLNTNAKKWRLEFWHAQPLKLSEIKLMTVSRFAIENFEEFRWLARPAMSYTIFKDAQNYSPIKTNEAGRLEGSELRVLNIEIRDSMPNPHFSEPDDDEDGVANYMDNCVSVKNPAQLDLDNNGAGDACEDFDGDGIKNASDNCPDHPNRFQADEDADGLGDACDTEESRVTEKNKWLPWLAMGITSIILVVVVMGVVRKEG